MKTLGLNIYYQSLTGLFSPEEQNLFDLYILTKAQSNRIVHKDGFLARAEIKTLSNAYNQSLSNTYKRLNKLSRAGYIQKTKYGYVLTSTKLVLANLHNFKTFKSKKQNREYHPYAKVEIPNANDPNIISLVRLYYLLKQEYKRKNHRNGLYSKKSRSKLKSKSISPETLTIAYEYLRKAGKYSSKAVVRSLMMQLERIGAVDIEKSINAEGMNEINTYTIYPFKKVKWTRLNKTEPVMRPEDYLASLTTNATATVKTKIKKKRVLAKKTVKVERTELEQTIIDFVFKHLNKKIGKNSINKTLNQVLSIRELKDELLKVISTDNVNVQSKIKCVYNANAFGPWRTNTTYTVNYCTLVNTGGNYDGSTLTSIDDAKKERIAKQDEYLVNKYFPNHFFEDVEDYLTVLNESKAIHYGYGKFNIGAYLAI